jgi:hypothetical protein
VVIPLVQGWLQLDSITGRTFRNVTNPVLNVDSPLQNVFDPLSVLPHRSTETRFPSVKIRHTTENVRVIEPFVTKVGIPALSGRQTSIS